MCITHESGAGRRHDAQHRRVAGRGGDVVHHERTGVERRRGDGRLAGVDADRHTRLGREAGHDRHDPAELLGLVHRLGPRPGRLPADVEQVGTRRRPGAARGRPRRPGSRNRPPSEKESGVTLTMPITAGRSPHTDDQANIADAGYRDSAPGGGGRNAPVRELQAVSGVGPMRLIASARVAALLLKRPRTADVIVSEPGFFTPRIDMQKCSASTIDQHAARVEHLDHRVGDLGGQPFLHLGPLGEAVDQAGELRQPGDPAVVARDVGHVRHARGTGRGGARTSSAWGCRGP